MSNLRVIAGTARGMPLKAVPGDVTRPITDRVKEALFNILGADIQNASLLDMFAGTGAVGVEALSRGASFVRFFDKHHQAVKTVRHNLTKTGTVDSAEVVQVDSFTALVCKADRKFDYVYIAPPQYKGLWTRALRLVDSKPEWLEEDAWVIVQIDPVEDEPVELRNLIEFDRRKYGSTLLLFFVFDPSQPGGVS